MSKKTSYHPLRDPARVFKQHRKRQPIHPREKHWFRVGMLHGKDKRRVLEKSLEAVLPLRSARSGSYILRYREMYTLGFNQAREG